MSLVNLLICIGLIMSHFKNQQSQVATFNFESIENSYYMYIRDIIYVQGEPK